MNRYIYVAMLDDGLCSYILEATEIMPEEWLRLGRVNINNSFYYSSDCGNSA